MVWQSPGNAHGTRYGTPQQTVKLGPGWISYLIMSAFHNNFSIRSPEVLTLAARHEAVIDLHDSAMAGSSAMDIYVKQCIMPVGYIL